MFVMLFSLKMMETVRTATHSVSPALERRRTSVQNVQKVCLNLSQSFKLGVCLLSAWPATAVLYFYGYTTVYPALLQ